MLSPEVALLFTGVFACCYIVAIIVGIVLPEWKSCEFAFIVGLAVGSAWIGLGLWAYSQVFPLPLASDLSRNAPLYASVLWFIWTFATEIPLLVMVVPPILKACYKAFPFLRRDKE